MFLRENILVQSVPHDIISRYTPWIRNQALRLNSQIPIGFKHLEYSSRLTKPENGIITAYFCSMIVGALIEILAVISAKLAHNPIIGFIILTNRNDRCRQTQCAIRYYRVDIS